jgi:RimJ/RimL family protein N-acetyltransferase
LETERLVLRRHRSDDFAASASMWGDPRVTRYISSKAASPQDAWRRLLAYVGHWALLGFGYWAVEHKASGKFIGEVGFADFKRDVDPVLRGVPELGWAFATAVHGQGYATEAVRVAVEWGDRHLASSRVISLIDPENLASIRVAQKCGFTEVERTDCGGQPTLVWSRDRGPSARRPSGEGDAAAKAELDATVGAFFGAFSRCEDGRVPLDRLHALFVPDGILVQMGGSAPRVSSLAEFIAPRDALLNGGPLTQFVEAEIAESTTVFDDLAQRVSAYEKSGVLSGTGFRSRGVKMFQFVHTSEGWKILCVAWQDGSGPGE